MPTLSGYCYFVQMVLLFASVKGLFRCVQNNLFDQSLFSAQHNFCTLSVMYTCTARYLCNAIWHIVFQISCCYKLTPPDISKTMCFYIFKSLFFQLFQILNFLGKVHYCRFENLTICSCSYKNNTLKIRIFNPKNSRVIYP